MNGLLPRSLPLLPLLAVALLATCGGCQASRNVATPWSPKPDGKPGSIAKLFGAQDDEILVNPMLASLGRPEFEEAEGLFKAGKYKEAEKILKKLKKGGKYRNAPVREDAMFLLAECQFARKDYADAQDSYERLVKDYPSTRYLDRFSKRQFEIARYWLRNEPTATGDAIQKVNYEEPHKSEPIKLAPLPSNDPTRIIPILPNFFDKTRPMFDTDGRALEALKSIWLNDPTGPLADDALMLSATHSLRTKDWIEADRFFTLLTEEYPKSPHMEQALILSSHVKLMSYQGPAYDGKKLEQSKALKEQILKLYPKHADRERFLDEIRKIEEAQARHDWEMVIYYGRQRRPDAQAIYCQSIIDKFSSTTYADRAKQKLKDLEEINRSGRSRIQLPKPLKPKPKEPEEYEEKPAKVSL